MNIKEIRKNIYIYKTKESLGETARMTHSQNCGVGFTIEHFRDIGLLDQLCFQHQRDSRSACINKNTLFNYCSCIVQSIYLKQKPSAILDLRDLERFYHRKICQSLITSEKTWGCHLSWPRINIITFLTG